MPELNMTELIARINDFIEETDQMGELDYRGTETANMTSDEFYQLEHRKDVVATFRSLMSGN